MRHSLFYLLLLFLITGCSKHYSSEKLGWKITLPGKSWKVITPQPNEASSEKTKQLVEEFLNMKIDGSRVQEVVTIRKNDLSSLVSVIETYEHPSDNGYEQLLTEQHKKLKEDFKSKKIPAEYAIGATRIGGVMLDWYNIKTYNEPNKLPRQHRIFSCIRNNYIFSMVISSDNEADFTTLEDVALSSKFTTKE